MTKNITLTFGALLLTSSCVVQALYLNESSTSTTFRVCSKSPEKPSYTPHPPNLHIVTQLPAYNDRDYVQILQGTNFTGNLRVTRNGFIQTVMEAYNGHHNLVLRPDDIWIAILSQFSLYVNANAEKFRGQFVNFTEKKELNVIMNGTSVYDASYDGFVSVMIEKIHENLIDDEIRNWVIPDFTTTTDDDVITSGVILMATLKHYFVYKGTILCGIPSITLEGSIDDWKKIERKLTKFDQYDLSKWSEMLKPIIAQFIQAKSGNVDENFWENIFYYENINVGCGSVNEISGWITTFAAFDANGVWQGGEGHGGKIWPRIEPEDIPPGVVEVDVIIDDNGREYKTKMFAGHMANEILKDGYTLQPKSGWAIALRSEDKTETSGTVATKNDSHEKIDENLKYTHDTLDFVGPDDSKNGGIEEVNSTMNATRTDASVYDYEYLPVTLPKSGETKTVKTIIRAKENNGTEEFAINQIGQGRHTEGNTESGQNSKAGEIRINGENSEVENTLNTNSKFVSVSKNVGVRVAFSALSLFSLLPLAINFL